MMESLAIVFFTAIFSSALTLGAAWWLYRRHLHDALNERWAREQESLGDLIEQRVRAGVLSALKSISSGEMLRDTTRNVSRSGAEIVGESLDVLLGRKRR